jgi:hypothetical protein
MTTNQHDFYEDQINGDRKMYSEDCVDKKWLATNERRKQNEQRFAEREQEERRQRETRFSTVTGVELDSDVPSAPEDVAPADDFTPDSSEYSESAETPVK